MISTNGSSNLWWKTGYDSCKQKEVNIPDIGIRCQSRYESGQLNKSLKDRCQKIRRIGSLWKNRSNTNDSKISKNIAESERNAEE